MWRPDGSRAPETTTLIVGGEDHPTGRGGHDIAERYRRLEGWTRERFPIKPASGFLTSKTGRDPRATNQGDRSGNCLILCTPERLTFGYLVGRHVPWGYSRIALVAVAAAVVFTASGLPFRIVLRMKKITATMIANKPSRPIEPKTQLACEPKK